MKNTLLLHKIMATQQPLTLPVPHKSYPQYRDLAYQASIHVSAMKDAESALNYMKSQGLSDDEILTTITDSMRSDVNDSQELASKLGFKIDLGDAPTDSAKDAVTKRVKEAGQLACMIITLNEEQMAQVIECYTKYAEYVPNPDKRLTFIEFRHKIGYELIQEKLNVISALLTSKERFESAIKEANVTYYNATKDVVEAMPKLPVMCIDGCEAGLGGEYEIPDPLIDELSEAVSVATVDQVGEGFFDTKALSSDLLAAGQKVDIVNMSGISLEDIESAKRSRILRERRDNDYVNQGRVNGSPDLLPVYRGDDENSFHMVLDTNAYKKVAAPRFSAALKACIDALTSRPNRQELHLILPGTGAFAMVGQEEGKGMEFQSQTTEIVATIYNDFVKKLPDSPDTLKGKTIHIFKPVENIQACKELKTNLERRGATVKFTFDIAGVNPQKDQVTVVLNAGDPKTSGVGNEGGYPNRKGGARSGEGLLNSIMSTFLTEAKVHAGQYKLQN